MDGTTAGATADPPHRRRRKLPPTLPVSTGPAPAASKAKEDKGAGSREKEKGRVGKKRSGVRKSKGRGSTAATSSTNADVGGSGPGTQHVDSDGGRGNDRAGGSTPTKQPRTQSAASQPPSPLAAALANRLATETWRQEASRRTEDTLSKESAPAAAAAAAVAGAQGRGGSTAAAVEPRRRRGHGSQRAEVNARLLVREVAAARIAQAHPQAAAPGHPPRRSSNNATSSNPRGGASTSGGGSGSDTPDRTQRVANVEAGSPDGRHADRKEDWVGQQGVLREQDGRHAAPRARGDGGDAEEEEVGAAAAASARSPTLSPEPHPWSPGSLLAARGAECRGGSPHEEKSTHTSTHCQHPPLPDPLRRDTSLQDSGLSLDDLGHISVSPTGVGVHRPTLFRSLSRGSSASLGGPAVNCAEACGAEATLRCPECALTFCAACAEDVHRRRSFRSHTVRPLTDRRGSWSVDLSDPFARDHDGSGGLSGCVSPISPDPGAAHPADAGAVPTASAAWARALAREVRKQRDDWKASLASVATLLEILKGDRESLTAELRDHFKKLHRALDLREAALGREIEIGHAARVLPLDREADRLRAAVTESKKLIRSARALPSDSSADASELVGRLEAVALTSSHCDPGPLLARAAQTPMALRTDGFAETVASLRVYGEVVSQAGD
eukprot:m.148758 g.148758  ORF g.148758 m.148758 type:complete len:671 (+) comp14220_c0_seq1:174-2186(+)